MITQQTSSIYKTTYVTKITLALFLILLFWRMVILQGMAIQQGIVPFSAEVIYICASYGLISVIIWLNRMDLQSLNIDSKFIILFVAVGYLYSLILPVKSGVFLALVATVILWWLSSNKLQFEYVSSRFRQTSLFILIILAPQFIRLIIIILRGSLTLPDAKTIIEAVYTASFTNVIFEEVVYRGLLWMFLARAGLKGHQIIVTQAIFFWLSHLYYFNSNPIAFWFFLPFVSIMLGIIVLRSKKILPSIVGHFLYNFLATLFQ